MPLLVKNDITILQVNRYSLSHINLLLKLAKKTRMSQSQLMVQLGFSLLSPRSMSFRRV